MTLHASPNTWTFSSKTHCEFVITDLSSMTNLSYRTWRCLFQNYRKGLNLINRKEIMLLSMFHRLFAKRIRTFHLKRGPRVVWDKLKECYGSYNITTDCTLQANNFPKISSKDFFKLREFSDLYGNSLTGYTTHPKTSIQSSREVIVPGFQLQPATSCFLSSSPSIHRYYRPRW